METVSLQYIPGNISHKLTKIIDDPSMYPGFPKIPHGVFSQDGGLQSGYSLYKKGASFFIINDGMGLYIETIDALDVSKIVFDFTQQELESGHIGKTIRNEVHDIIETPEVETFERALRAAISQKLYSTLSVYFGVKLSNKLYELSGHIGDTMFSYLARISLIPLHGSYIVLDTDIHFSRQELEQIKRAVFT